MNVCFIFRQPRKSFFSIEKVFTPVIAFVKSKCHVSEVFLPHSQLSPGNIVSNLSLIRKQKAEIFHVTGDVHYIVMALPKRKTVLTIHDCVFIENTSGIKRAVLKYFFLDWPVLRACLITTISEKSKQDIINYTGCASDKIKVIPNPVSSTIYYQPQIFNVAKPIMLFLGSKPNKNLLRVLEALQNITCHLYVVGIISAEAQDLIDKYKIECTVTNNLTEQELAIKYVLADIILFPSVYEGFGLPITEGNKAGRVVITSNISPMKEIAADAACLVDPFDVLSIRGGVLKVIEDEAYRIELVNRGFENVKRFNADFIAEQYLNIYQRLANGHQCVEA
jgi:glycosyltransferase involved in cell wall biosynthesis